MKPPAGGDLSRPGSRQIIISASYRTDIPAFYAGWFANRLEAGYCMVRNPYGGPDYRVSLAAEDVTAFTFWTRNAGPLLPLLERMRSDSRHFSVTFTILGYPRMVDERVIDTASAIAQVRALQSLHPRIPVWRYDPILITDLTPPDWHRENFARLSASLRGLTDEVTISFAAFYRKTEAGLHRALASEGVEWRDPPIDEKRALTTELSAIAAENGQQLTVCSQADVSADLVPAARCIDAVRLSDIAGDMLAARQKGNRPGCLCAESRDIGAYDSCPHGCAYCYAVRHRDRALTNYRNHDPAAERLL